VGVCEVDRQKKKKKASGLENRTLFGGGKLQPRTATDVREPALEGPKTKKKAA